MRTRIKKRNFIFYTVFFLIGFLFFTNNFLFKTSAFAPPTQNPPGGNINIQQMRAWLCWDQSLPPFTIFPVELVNDTSLRVRWQTLPGVHSYRIAVSTTAGGPYTEAGIVPHPTDFLVVGSLTPLQRYFFVMQGRTSATNPWSDFSAEVNQVAHNILPVPTRTPSSTPAPTFDGWTDTAITINFSGSNISNSGFMHYMYCVTTGASCTPDIQANQVVLSTRGEHTVCVRAIGQYSQSSIGCSADKAYKWDHHYTVSYTATTGGVVNTASRYVRHGQTSAAPGHSANNCMGFINFTRISGSGGTLDPATGAVTNVTGNQTIQANFAENCGSNCAIGASCGGGRKASHTPGLIAFPNDEGNFNWSAAMTHCASRTYSGFNNWHLPNLDNLNRLFINRVAIGNFISTYYWSSTEDTAVNAWVQCFSTGFPNPPLNKTNAYRVRCIRAY